MRSRAVTGGADGHSRDFTSCTEQFSFLQLLRRRRRERGCGASDTYVCKAALVAFMRFLSVIFSNINKALVSCPCGGKKQEEDLNSPHHQELFYVRKPNIDITGSSIDAEYGLLKLSITKSVKR